MSNVTTLHEEAMTFQYFELVNAYANLKAALAPFAEHGMAWAEYILEDNGEPNMKILTTRAGFEPELPDLILRISDLLNAATVYAHPSASPAWLTQRASEGGGRG
jgi:hypothetical protein